MSTASAGAIWAPSSGTSELGHVLGLDHDRDGRLMSAHYDLAAQQCVDKAAAQAVAARRNLPVEQLNWCDPTAAAARR